MLRRGVENVRIYLRKHDGKRPLPSLFKRRGRHSGKKERIDLHIAHRAGRAIEPGKQRALAARIENVGVCGIWSYISAFAAADRIIRREHAGPGAPEWTRAFTLHANS